jgi:hypothetical protein
VYKLLRTKATEFSFSINYWDYCVAFNIIDYNQSDEYEGQCRIVAYFNVISRHFLGRIEENYKQTSVDHFGWVI